jgi:hypothetical protein
MGGREGGRVNIEGFFMVVKLIFFLAANIVTSE